MRRDKDNAFTIVVSVLVILLFITSMGWVNSHLAFMREAYPSGKDCCIIKNIEWDTLYYGEPFAIFSLEGIGKYVFYKFDMPVSELKNLSYKPYNVTKGNETWVRTNIYCIKWHTEKIAIPPWGTEEHYTRGKVLDSISKTGYAEHRW